jgi:hypothetical protein
MPPAASTLVTAGFVVLPLLVAAGFVFACDRAARHLDEPAATRRRRTAAVGAAVLVWLLATGVVGTSGVLRRTDGTPPPFAFLVLAVAVLGLGLPLSRLGALLVAGLPLSVLVGFQAFRLPLELLMHRAYTEGSLPVQMTYSGRNFDVLTGMTAIFLGAWLAVGRVPRWVIAAWNLAGFALLANIVGVAILSTPLFAAFGPQHVNDLVTYPPFVWLPAVLVLAAFIGHVLVWRWLWDTRTGRMGVRRAA